MDDGYGVDLERLRATGRGIHDIVGLGVAAERGDSFANLSMDGPRLGHQGLSDAMSQFCSRWSWAVGDLARQGDQFAEQLGLAAGSYDDMERYLTGAITDVLEQVEASSVGDPVPDFSIQSWERASNDFRSTRAQLPTIPDVR
jgi:hypothetical protein